jgi:hypothetical protein
MFDLASVICALNSPCFDRRLHSCRAGLANVSGTELKLTVGEGRRSQEPSRDPPEALSFKEAGAFLLAPRGRADDQRRGTIALHDHDPRRRRAAQPRRRGRARTLRGPCAKARSNIRAVWHLDEFVAGNARAVPRVHPFPADLTVRRMVIEGDGFVVRDFIQRPAVGALKGLSHLTNIPWLRSRLLAFPNTS